MKGFEPTGSYKLIYIYAIWNEAHKGMLKLGEASLASSKTYKELPPDCADLNLAAKKRIDTETVTSGTAYELLYTELAVIEKIEPDGTVGIIPISNRADKRVHEVLKASGIKVVYPDGVKSKEWFEMSLQTAKNAIKALKEGRKTLDAGEIVKPEDEIIFRGEQLDAIEKTKKRFMKCSTMLWNAKMRYGKTCTALELVRQMKFRRVIIITHRPVVGSGWQEDFHKIFKDEDAHYTFVFKDKSSSEDDYDQAIDGNNDAQLHELDQQGRSFIYFASMQDLRGSKRVGGKFDKNNAVFDMDWDMLIEDEAHEGTQTDLGKDVKKKICKKHTKVLSLSGTPFNIINQFDDDGVYTWDYIMEQYAKEHWDEEHPDEPNPYIDLPKMHIYTYDLGNMIQGYDEYALEGKAFNFREFFKVWTGDPLTDGKEIPEGASVGDFIHSSDVLSFLNLISKEDADNNYPYSTQEYRDMFKHTLWMLPGVKEARALSAMLQAHPVFSSFAIANVAGSGDEEENYDDALAEVRSKIKNNEYTITLSCGKLTTGVTVKEWTAVFILTGSQNTSAAGYLQTIFRAQSPGSIGGRRKEHCYVFDFAPDRSIRVFAEAARASRGIGGGSTDEVLKQFINFCPIIAVDGTNMKQYDVSSMMGQIKRIQVERAIKNGFDDTSIYNDELMKLDKMDLKDFERLKEIVGSHQTQGQVNNVKINQQGFTEEEYKELKRIRKKPPKVLTEEEKKLLEKLKEQRAQKKSAISILRAISIRMPLLIYGADVPFDEDITLEWFVDKVDKESWEEFMPYGVSKALFRKFMKYYDKDVLITAGREIRRLAKDADKLPPTKRVKTISTIFSYFKNPDKETVLTPWRVVNMHMSDCIGGWCFYDEEFREDTREKSFRLAQPRFVDRGEVTRDIFFDSKPAILELNSKSGLYPLYITYSLYRAKLGEIPEEDITEQAQVKYWNDIVKNCVYVVCKTPMAKSITKRTLVGYSEVPINAEYYKNLVDTLKNTPEKFTKKVIASSWWKKEGNPLKFNAIISNPPYMAFLGGASPLPIYHHFVNQAKKMNPNYISMITPARWFNTGTGLDGFREEMLNDDRIAVLHDYPDATMCFSNVEIKGGVTYYLWDSKHHDKCDIYTHNEDGTITYSKRSLLEPGMDTYIRKGTFIPILEKVRELKEPTISTMISSRDPFGFDIRLPGSMKVAPHKYSLSKTNEEDVEFYYNGWRKEGVGYVSISSVNSNKEIVDKYKVLVPKAWGTGNENNDWLNPFVVQPHSVCTETYLVFGAFDSKEEAENLISYIQTKFFHAMVSILKISQNAAKGVYNLVPMQDFTKKWSDSLLYKKYNLSDEEINLIEDTIHIN